MTTAAPLRRASAHAPPATPVEGFVVDAFEAAFELLFAALSVFELSVLELSAEDVEMSVLEQLLSSELFSGAEEEPSELVVLSGCDGVGVGVSFFSRPATASFIAFAIASTSACSVMFLVLSIAARAFSTAEKSL